MEIENGDWDFIWVVFEEIIKEGNILKPNYVKRLENIKDKEKNSKSSERIIREIIEIIDDLESNENNKHLISYQSQAYRDICNIINKYLKNTIKELLAKK